MRKTSIVAVSFFLTFAFIPSLSHAQSDNNLTSLAHTTWAGKYNTPRYNSGDEMWIRIDSINKNESTFEGAFYISVNPRFASSYHNKENKISGTLSYRKDGILLYFKYSSFFILSGLIKNGVIKGDMSGVAYSEFLLQEIK